MQLTPDTEQAHRRLGEINLRFLQFVRRNPECLDATQFAPPGLGDEEWLTYNLHPWPTFIDRERSDEAATVAVGLDRLVKSLPERIFDRDPQRLAAYHDLDPEDMALALEHYSSTDHLISRGDYYDTPDGLKCLELNFSSFLGGWQDAIWRPIYRRNRLLSRFFDEDEVRLCEGSTTHQVFDHAATCAMRLGLHDAGELNLAVLLAEDNVQTAFEVDPASFFAQAWAEGLERLAPGLSGTMIIGCDKNLSVEDGHVHMAGRRIHVLLQYLREWKLPAEVLGCIRDGSFLAINGTAQYPLRSKLNLALLSEMADSPLFDEAERSLIQRHIPWSRKLVDGETTYEGTTVHLPSWLEQQRESMILKYARSSQGEHVFLGRCLSPSAWQELVGKALAEGGWLAQEFVAPSTYVYQTGERAAAVHEGVWGLFVFGGTYGGGFMRILPKTDGDRPQVVNLDHGAARSPLLAVEEEY